MTPAKREGLAAKLTREDMAKHLRGMADDGDGFLDRDEVSDKDIKALKEEIIILRASADALESKITVRDKGVAARLRSYVGNMNNGTTCITSNFAEEIIAALESKATGGDELVEAVKNLRTGVSFSIEGEYDEARTEGYREACDDISKILALLKQPQETAHE